MTTKKKKPTNDASAQASSSTTSSKSERDTRPDTDPERIRDLREAAGAIGLETQTL